MIFIPNGFPVSSKLPAVHVNQGKRLHDSHASRLGDGRDKFGITARIHGAAEDRSFDSGLLDEGGWCSHTPSVRASSCESLRRGFPWQRKLVEYDL